MQMIYQVYLLSSICIHRIFGTRYGDICLVLFCQADTNGSLWAMDRQTFRRIVLKNAFKKRKMYEKLLESVPMLKTLEVREGSVVKLSARGIYAEIFSLLCQVNVLEILSYQN